MANICDNTFYAYSKDSSNLKVIEDFFEDWRSADVERCDNSIDCYFESRWTFPEAEMNKLYEKLPNKEDIYSRCLSVEYCNCYYALWVCNEDGWDEV